MTKAPPSISASLCSRCARRVQNLGKLSGPFPHLSVLSKCRREHCERGDWFDAGAVAVDIGSSVIDPAAIRRGDWPTLTERAREFVDAVRRARESN